MIMAARTRFFERGGPALIACLFWFLFYCAPVRGAEFGGTVLPTDVEPLPDKPGNGPFTTNLQMRLWQRLPAPLFFNTSVETTMRIETNPYQYPKKRTLLHQTLDPGTSFSDLSQTDQYTILSDLAQVSTLDNIHRINPNLTVGWAVTPRTQVFANTFFLRDSVVHNYPLNTNTGALGIGVQQVWSLTDKLSLQPQFIARELWQSQLVPVLDYLPGVTLQYTPTSNIVAFANALLQVRFAHFAGSYMRELDPFYTWGVSYQRGKWSFSAATTFLQNFREPFRGNALAPINNYSFVCDFEIDRPLLSRFPSLLLVARAEPVYNFHSHQTPGLAGMDFRFYYGLRVSAAKPPLNQTIQQLRQRFSSTSQIRQSLMEQENDRQLNPASATPIVYLTLHPLLSDSRRTPLTDTMGEGRPYDVAGANPGLNVRVQ